ncbi:hypothetical protein GGR50DRAFT_682599 [Xylaria sp. CBS 124048]|nr:hypothetical protein GGR50DRAFT_682599 [Xylaria sp. CBS 124048]
MAKMEPMEPTEPLAIRKKTDKVVSTNLITISSTHSFAEIKEAFERVIPPLDLTSYKTAVSTGDHNTARAAIQNLNLCKLYTFPPPRDFTALLRTIDVVRQAIVYEVGNPLVAAIMVQHNLDIALHMPRRVLVRVNADKVELRADALAPLVAKYGNPQIDEIARQLDEGLTDLLRDIAGLFKIGEMVHEENCNLQ